MPRLIIAEKPSVARDLARVLGANQKQKGYIQGNGWLITWCIGHLVELCEPHEYDANWKRWSMGTLPMTPPSFRLRPVKRTKEQYDIVERLLSRKDVDSVINACDAGREGELIFRYVYYLSGSSAQIQRLWISSMTDEAIKEGFERLQPGENYDNLWHAARCRSEADWLVGLNATRAMTLRFRQLAQGGDTPLFSVGRVQTPTLAMLTDRENEILNFVPEDYWQIAAHFQTPHGKYVGKWFRSKVDRFKTEAEAQALVEQLTGHPALVSQADKRTGRERPPLLFDLTRLQSTANKRYGFSAARTLEVAQALYEKHKLLTYPRTDSMHLSADMKPKILGIIRSLDVDPYSPFAQELLDSPKLPYPKRIFDNSKVSDHHAIIPTSKKPNLNHLSEEERKIYDLVVRRFLGGFYPDAVFEKTKLVTKILNETFVTHGKIIVDPGWRRVAGLDTQDEQTPSRKRGSASSDEKDEQGLLPPVQKGDTPDVEKLETLKKRTKAPPRHTEATLLSSMEGAGKFLEEEELQQALKDSGLGTPATRASIIETLLSRQYVQREKKNLVPTPKGMHLIASMPVENLHSPQLTGEWEARMSRMARGEYPSDTFQREVFDFVHSMVDCIRTAQFNALPPDVESTPRSGGGQAGGNRNPNNANKTPFGTCPQCQGVVLEFEKVFACRGKDAQEQGCDFRIFREVASKKISPNMGKQLLEKGKTSLLKGFTSKAGNKFNAVLVLQPNGRVSFEFPDNANTPQTKKDDDQTLAPSQKTSKTNTPPQQTSNTTKAKKEPKTPSSGRQSSSTQHTQPTLNNTSTDGLAMETHNTPPKTTSTRETKPQPHEPNTESPFRPASDFLKDQPAASPHALRAQVSATIPTHTPPNTPQPERGPSHNRLGTCPQCKRGEMIRGKRAWGCNQWREGCRMLVPFVFEGRPFQEAEIHDLLQRNKIGPLSGFKRQNGDTYDAIVLFDFGLYGVDLCLQPTDKKLIK